MRGQFSGEGIELERALGFRIYRVNQLFRAALYRTFRSLGHEMTPEQWIVLVRLWREDALSQTEIVEATLKDKATISRIIDVMERAGLVVRKADPEDSRGRRVHATRKAQELRATALPRARELAANIEEGISERDLEITQRTLRRLEENLRALDASALQEP